MRKNANRLGRHGRGCSGSQHTGERKIPLAERLRRMLDRRIAEVTGRGGRDLSDKDLSAAVVDISRLVTAAARLKKLDETDAEAGGKNGPSLEAVLTELYYGDQGASDERGNVNVEGNRG